MTFFVDTGFSFTDSVEADASKPGAFAVEPERRLDANW